MTGEDLLTSVALKIEPKFVLIMPCPFLTKLSYNYINNNAQTLLKVYGNQCPVMARHLKNMKNTNKTTKHKCPFLQGMPTAVKEVSEDDNTIQVSTETNTFDYNNFFYQQILKKKLDHSYRIFKRVNKPGELNQFPSAVEFSSGRNTITIWCSNDYLGMASHPEVKRSAQEALEKYGTGSGGTRNISGNSTLHEALEETLAGLHQKEAALLFTSCFVANDSTLYTLGKTLPNCHIFSDEGNHASMIQGIRNSRAKKYIYRHNDPEHLEELLKGVDRKVPKIVAFETVHSMFGTICDLEKLCDVAHKYEALTFVDEVHAVGIYGEHGGGIGERDKMFHKMDIISGTLGKAYGNVGGYIASNSTVVDWIRSYTSGFIFTTSLPPSVVAGAAKAVEILASPEGARLRTKLEENAMYLKISLINNGFPVDYTPSHIVPIKIGDPVRCTAICDDLLKEKGHYIQAINYPTVARGQERLRLAPTPYHDKQLIDRLIRDLKEVWNKAYYSSEDGMEDYII